MCAMSFEQTPKRSDSDNSSEILAYITVNQLNSYPELIFHPELTPQYVEPIVF